MLVYPSVNDPETPFHHKIMQLHYVSVFRLLAETSTGSGRSKCKSLSRKTILLGKRT